MAQPRKSKSSRLAALRVTTARMLSNRIGNAASLTMTRREVGVIVSILALGNQIRAIGRPRELDAAERDREIAEHFWYLREGGPRTLGWKGRAVGDLAEWFEVDERTVRRAIKRFLPAIESAPKLDKATALSLVSGKNSGQ